MDVDRQLHLLGGGKHRFEPGVIEEQSAAGAHGEGADEAQLVDTALELVGGRCGIEQRDGGEAPKAGGMLGNLTGQLVVHLPA